jgi:hypothetical protein
MVERKKRRPEREEDHPSAPRGRELIRVDRPPERVDDPNSFSWADALPVGWSARLDRLLHPPRPTPVPARPTRRGEKEE